MNASADLEIIVTTPWGDGAPYLEFKLHSTNPDVDLHYTTFRGEQLHEPENFQKELLERLEKLGLHLSADGEPRRPEEVITELANIGHDLYADLFPPQLKEEYWRLRDKVRTLLLTSDEPWIPWELVKPFCEEEEEDFLCLRFAMSRWLAGKGDPGERGPAQTLRIGKLASIAVKESWDRKAPKLAHVAREREILSRLAIEDGVEPCDLWQASFPQVKKLLEGGGKDLLHFAGHGNTSRIHLTDRSVSPSDLAGRMEAKLCRTRPLVFLNACRVAQQGWSLTGLGGWTPRWVKRCGCGAFLGPQWVVNDQRACDFAEFFYQGLRNKKPLGEAVRAARERLRDKAPHDPAWLAYCLYGHPDARVVFGKATDGVPDSPPKPCPPLVSPPAEPDRPHRPVPPWLAVVLALILALALGLSLRSLIEPQPEPDLIRQLVDSIDSQMLAVANGSFTMGSPAQQIEDLLGRNPTWREEDFQDEVPARVVYLDEYEIGKHEVTNWQYGVFHRLRHSDELIEVVGNADEPAVNVSWDQASEFCEWLIEISDKYFHLPTEAQWEKAARWVDERPYPWGNAEPSLRRANYGSNNLRFFSVGSLREGMNRETGTMEMAGNAAEWCWDWYGGDYYRSAPSRNPSGPNGGFNKVVRGGSWRDPKFRIRCAARRFAPPSQQSSGIGFRVVRGSTSPLERRHR